MGVSLAYNFRIRFASLLIMVLLGQQAWSSSKSRVTVDWVFYKKVRLPSGNHSVCELSTENLKAGWEEDDWGWGETNHPKVLLRLVKPNIPNQPLRIMVEYSRRERGLYGISLRSDKTVFGRGYDVSSGGEIRFLMFVPRLVELLRVMRDSSPRNLRLVQHGVKPQFELEFSLRGFVAGLAEFEASCGPILGVSPEEFQAFWYGGGSFVLPERLSPQQVTQWDAIYRKGYE